MVKLSCIDVDEQEDLALQVSLSPFSKTKKSWKRSKICSIKHPRKNLNTRISMMMATITTRNKTKKNLLVSRFAISKNFPKGFQRVGMRTISKEMTRRSFALYS